MALVGFAVAWVSRSGLLNKAVDRGSTVKEMTTARANAPEFLNTPPAPPLEPPSSVVQSIDPPNEKEKSWSAPEDDPEQVAVLISSLSETEVRNWLAKLTNQDLSGNTARLLLRRWVELNPTAAINWVTQLGEAGARQELVDVAAVAWSQNDLPKALTWVESLPAGDAKHHALADLGYEVARIDPVNALQIAAQLPASEYSNGLMIHALAQYASADPGQSQQLAISLPPGSVREQALATVATVLAQQDGAGAARFALENISGGPDFDRAVIGVVQLWGQNNLADASAWVRSFPDSPVRDQAVQSLGLIAAH